MVKYDSIKFTEYMSYNLCVVRDKGNSVHIAQALVHFNYCSIFRN